MFRVVNMEHEMYNDGLFFYEDSLKQGDFGDQQRCERFAVVSFASSFEAFLNARLKSKLEANPSVVQNGPDILDFLVNGFANTKKIPRELTSIRSKVQLLEELYNVRNKLDQAPEYIDFYNKVISLRNSIVHYSYGNFSSVYSSQITHSASVAAKLLRDLIRTFTTITKIEYPTYYNETKYRAIV